MSVLVERLISVCVSGAVHFTQGCQCAAPCTGGRGWRGVGGKQGDAGRSQGSRDVCQEAVDHPFSFCSCFCDCDPPYCSFFLILLLVRSALVRMKPKSDTECPVKPGRSRVSLSAFNAFSPVIRS